MEKSVYDKDGFIAKAKEIYGDKYDYSKVKYVDMHTKVLIKCNECDTMFWQYPYSHLQGHACPYCNHRSYAYTTEEFIAKANLVHNGKYSYDKTVYKNNKTKVLITCPIHGDFYQNPKSHLQGRGCPKCGFILTKNKKTMTRDEFIERARKVHGDKYDYSKVEYKGMLEKVCIICPEHGEFWQTPSNHINCLAGCPKCNNIRSEQTIINLLKENNISYEYQKKFDWLRGMSLDFYVPQYKVGIECQGEQHFNPVEIFGGENEFKRQTERDKLKYQLCKNNGVKLMYFTLINENKLPKEYIDAIYTNKIQLLKEIKLIIR